MMKEFIKYIYNIKVDNYTVNNDNYYIKSGQKDYMFIPFYGNLINLYKKYIILKKNGMCCHDIVFNRNNKIVSNYNNKQYILLKKNININNPIEIGDLYNPIPIINCDEYIDIKNKWQIKNDYYESILEKICSKNIELVLYFDYYLGLGELAINLLNYINFSKIPLYAQHKRLKYNNSISDYYDPIDMIVDSKIRDISFYIKTIFFDNVIAIEEIKKFITRLVLSDDEAIMFFARMVYPDYYFDICDEILNKNVNNIKLEKCIKKNIQYEIFLKDIYQYLYNIYNIPNIEWFSIK